jgi:hypothetical protein
MPMVVENDIPTCTECTGPWCIAEDKCRTCERAEARTRIREAGLRATNVIADVFSSHDLVRQWRDEMLRNQATWGPSVAVDEIVWNSPELGESHNA